MAADLPPSSRVTCLQARGAGHRDLAPGRRRPGERHLVDARMRDQVGARRAIARHHVEHAGRQVDRRHDVGEQQGVERRLRSRLEHDGAAGQQRGDDLADGEELRHVPRHDGGDDADGLLDDANVVAVEARSCFLPRVVAGHLAEGGHRRQRKPGLDVLGERDGRADRSAEISSAISARRSLYAAASRSTAAMRSAGVSRGHGPVVERRPCRCHRTVDVGGCGGGARARSPARCVVRRPR